MLRLASNQVLATVRVPSGLGRKPPRAACWPGSAPRAGRARRMSSWKSSKAYARMSDKASSLRRDIKSHDRGKARQPRHVLTVLPDDTSELSEKELQYIRKIETLDRDLRRRQVRLAARWPRGRRARRLG